MAETKKPNTICRNCKKEYYSCYHCVKSQNWRSIACCVECRDAYFEKILISRGEVVVPQRTDMIEDEVVELITETPIEEVIEKTQEELSDYIEENPDLTLTEVVEKVNEDIKKSSKKNKKKGLGNSQF